MLPRSTRTLRRPCADLARLQDVCGEMQTGGMSKKWRKKNLARTLRDLVLSVFSFTLRGPCAWRSQNLARTLRGQILQYLLRRASISHDDPMAEHVESMNASILSAFLVREPYADLARTLRGMRPPQLCHPSASIMVP